MNEQLNNTASEHLTFMLDGELDKIHEAELYTKLGSDAELQSEMNELMSIRKSIEKDTEAFTPPPSATSHIFGSLGINNPSATVLKTAASSSLLGSLASSATGVISQYWKPIGAGLSATFIAVFFMFSSEQDNQSNDTFSNAPAEYQNLGRQSIIPETDYNNHHNSNSETNNIASNLKLNEKSALASQSNNEQENSNLLASMDSHKNITSTDELLNALDNSNNTSENEINLITNPIENTQLSKFSFTDPSKSKIWQDKIKTNNKTKSSLLSSNFMINTRSGGNSMSNFSAGFEVNNYIAYNFSITAAVEVINNPLTSADASSYTDIDPAGYLNLGLEYSIYDFKPFVKGGLGRYSSYFTYKIEAGLAYNIYNNIDLNASYDFNSLMKNINDDNILNNTNTFVIGLKYGL